MSTGIQWTDETWTPLTGCTRVSPGCDGCYAFQLHDQRHVAFKRGRWDSAPAQYHQPFSTVQLLPDRLMDPLRWKRPRRIFLTSMGDVFHEDVPDSYISQLFAVMALTPWHTYQVLTKRPERMLAWFQERWQLPSGKAENRHDQVLEAAFDILTFRKDGDADRFWSRDGQEAARYTWPLQNVWLGTTIEDPERARRLDVLRQTPAAVRFLSLEPLLARLDARSWFEDCMTCDIHGPVPRSEWTTQKTCGRCMRHTMDAARATLLNRDVRPAIHWAIIGGESGPRARPCDLGWIREIVAQCRTAGVAPFVKQLGSVWAKTNGAKHSHGGEISEWPEDLRVREFPEAR